MARIKSNISQEAFDYIKSKINNYDLKPMDAVSDIAISQELNMSRTPVKEAIIQLTKCGLVRKERTKFSVVPITESDIVEILEVRETLEFFAARKICETGGLTAEQIKCLQDILSNQRDCLDTLKFEENFQLDSRFHEYILTCSGNERALNIEKETMLQGERLRWLSMITLDRYFKTVDEHEQIIKALTVGDLSAAEKSITNHYKNTLSNYLVVISQNKDWQEIIVNLKFVLTSKN